MLSGAEFNPPSKFPHLTHVTWLILEVNFVFMLDAALARETSWNGNVSCGRSLVGWGIVSERQRRSRNCFCKFSIVHSNVTNSSGQIARGFLRRVGRSPNAMIQNENHDDTAVNTFGPNFICLEGFLGKGRNESKRTQVAPRR